MPTRLGKVGCSIGRDEFSMAALYLRREILNQYFGDRLGGDRNNYMTSFNTYFELTLAGKNWKKR
jgi:hypothetical protein